MGYCHYSCPDPDTRVWQSSQSMSWRHVPWTSAGTHTEPTSSSGAPTVHASSRPATEPGHCPGRSHCGSPGRTAYRLRGRAVQLLLHLHRRPHHRTTLGADHARRDAAGPPRAPAPPAQRGTDRRRARSARGFRDNAHQAREIGGPTAADATGPQGARRSRCDCRRPLGPTTNPGPRRSRRRLRSDARPHLRRRDRTDLHPVADPGPGTDRDAPARQRAAGWRGRPSRGLPDPSAFVRIFRQTTGCTPRAYQLDAAGIDVTTTGLPMYDVIKP